MTLNRATDIPPEIQGQILTRKIGYLVIFVKRMNIMEMLEIGSREMHYPFNPTAVSTWYSMDRFCVEYHIKLMNQPTALTTVLKRVILTFHLCRLLFFTGTSIIQVTARDADDPTYGNSARLVYAITQGQDYFSVDAQTGLTEALHVLHTRSELLTREIPLLLVVPFKHKSQWSS